MENKKLYTLITPDGVIYECDKVHSNPRKQTITLFNTKRVLKQLPSYICTHRLELWMAKNNMDTQDIADMFGVHRTTVSRWLHNRRTVPWKVMQFISTLTPEDWGGELENRNEY